jgi:hypothetical protein
MLAESLISPRILAKANWGEGGERGGGSPTFLALNFFLCVRGSKYTFLANKLLVKLVASSTQCVKVYFGQPYLSPNYGT